MLVADTYLGHRTDDDVAARLDGADPSRVVLSATDRRRSRVRTETDDGRDIGIVVARDLTDGDILETESGALVLVDLADIEAAIVSLEGTDVSPTTALQVGHALGNRHRDVAVRDDEVVVAVADSRERTERTLADLCPDGTPVRFESVSPALFDGGPDHRHGDDHSHGHTGHDHADGNHAHSHGPRSLGEGGR
ncbi:urease accessory protein UreE [Halorientalis litorea]|jgi:urease accessory protein|uniref:urease accessory protein UreE n=1 Tax=Halorientalis litorea TaxID=2931977 RepID=UPI001FF3A72B|nr:urease accessory protein UreE [Halorientalis litorea]